MSFLTLGTFALLMGTAAHAEDWSGWTIGVNAGLGTSNTKTDYTYVATPALAPPGFEDVFGPGDTGVATALSLGFIPASLGTAGVGAFTGGAQVGYDHQVNHAVLGFLADIDWMNGVRSTSFFSDLGGLTNTSTSTAGVQWLGTFRGRVGIPVSNALLFASGGLAFGGVTARSTSAVDDGSNIDLYAGDASGVRVGFAVGGGASMAISPRVTLTGEYLYYDLGSVNYDVAPANAVALGEGIATAAHNRFNGSIIRLGLNFRLGQ